MLKNKFTIIILGLIFLAAPTFASALTVGELLQGNQQQDGITAESYLVLNADTDQVLAQKNPAMPRVPASLTKLVTALVFLDSNPNLNKIVTIQKSDQTGGGCAVGGACIATKPGVSYRLNDLFHSSLIASANNATMAEARSTGLSQTEFVARMNRKAESLGATQTKFVEPTGMDPANTTTAEDFSKIVKAAFANPVIQKINVLPNYAFSSTNYSKYKHNLKNTDKLLGDEQFTIVGAKTGYLEESKSNFAVLLKDQLGNNLIVVLFGSKNSATEFAEARQLAFLGSMTYVFSRPLQSVLGTSTASSTY